MIRIGVLVMSDKGSRGERVDACGDVIREMVREIDGEVVTYDIIPDEQPIIEAHLVDYADNQRLDLVLTSGGTGFSPRDVTPEATRAVVQKLAPGIAEVMRAESLKITPRAMLTRAVAGIRGRTLIINLPGSPKAVRECLAVVMPALPHGIETLRGEASECAGPIKQENE